MPLRVPFKTALRTVNSVEDVVVEIHTDTGAVGYGEAPPTGVITGDTTGAIIGANQAWTPKQAVKILNAMQHQGLGIELVEQPVKAHNFEGLKYVTERSYVPVLADESVFSPEDAMTIMQMGAADLINIKLMKCGGLYNALKIVSAAEVFGVECMIGCMLETKISVNAAVHLACAKNIITKVDLDGPVLCSEDPILGGAVFNEKIITVSDAPGLGIRGIEPGRLVYLD